MLLITMNLVLIYAILPTAVFAYIMIDDNRLRSTICTAATCSIGFFLLGTALFYGTGRTSPAATIIVPFAIMFGTVVWSRVIKMFIDQIFFDEDDDDDNAVDEPEGSQTIDDTARA
jgi:hypothetical protein